MSPGSNHTATGYCYCNYLWANTFSVLITRNRLCSSLQRTVSSVLNVMLFHIRAIFISSQYHLLIVQLRSLSSSALSLSSAPGNWQPLDFSFVSAQLWQEISLVPRVYPLFGFCCSSLNFRRWLIGSTYTHIIKLPWLQKTIYSVCGISNNSLSTPIPLNKVNKQDNAQFSLLNFPKFLDVTWRRSKKE